jgi:hypothetical protein
MVEGHHQVDNTLEVDELIQLHNLAYFFTCIQVASAQSHSIMKQISSKNAGFSVNLDFESEAIASQSPCV